MKTKTALMLIFAAIVWSGVAHGQNASAPAGLAADSAAPKVEAADAAGSTNAPAQAEKTGAGSMDSTNAEPGEAVEITLQPDVTLPNAIQLLARIAKINYQFDPQLLNEKAEDKVTPLPVPVIGTEIRWKGITAAQALQALLDNYNWQMIPDPKTGISRVTRKDARSVDPMVTKVIPLRYIPATNLYAQITNMAFRMSPRTVMVPDMRTSQLIVMAPERDLTVLEGMIERLDAAGRQVLIEAMLIETTRNPTSIKGIDWSGTLESQNVTFGNGITTGTSKDSTTTGTATLNRGDGSKITMPGVTSSSQQRDLSTAVGKGGLSMDTAKGFNPTTAFLNADGVHAVLSFLNTDTETDQQALPRSVAMDGVETELAVIQNVPVFEQNQSPGLAGSQPLTTVKPTYEEKVGESIINEVGVKLRVTPRIVGLTNVLLNLHPEISDQDPIPARFTLNGTDNTSPVFNRRKITTQATVPSGFTLVLGGLNHDFSTKSYKKVPILGDIPGLGLLFRHENKSRTKQNLMIFVTPTIIQDTDFQSTKTEFLKNRFVEKPDAEEGPWNSGKPKDWTKPKPGVEPAYQPTAQ